MDFNRQNAQRNTTALPSSQTEPLIPQRGNKKSRRGIKVSKNPVGWGLLLIAVVLIVFGLLWFFRVNSVDEIGQVNKNEYQAIFLSNGQVYFGKLDTLNSQYAKMTDIFYLQVNQSVQPKQESSSSQPQNVSLVKLGNELHGPEDAMMINRQQILFWENLKPSGKVSQAIKRYQQTGGNSSSTTTPTSSDLNNSSNSSTTTGSSTNSSTSSTPTSTTGGTQPTAGAAKP